MTAPAPAPDSDPAPRLVLLDRPAGPDCTLCGLPRLVALASGILLCVKCDRWPQRDQLLAAIRAECACGR